MKSLDILLAVPVALCCACGSVEVAGPKYADPTLAYVAPGVEVVADWDTPVFFVDDFYWYWDGGGWYRSTVLGGERIRVHDVPPTLAHVDRPWTYAHLRPERRATRPVPAYHAEHTAIRDHRGR